MAKEHPTAIPQSVSHHAAQAAMRLSIFHVMLWTFCSAAFLALRRFVAGARTGVVGVEISRGSLSIHEVSDVLHSLAIGAVLTGATTLAYARRRSGSGWAVLRHPGHWLLLAQAALLVAVLPMSMILAVMSLGPRNWGAYGVGFMFYGFAYVLPAAIYLHAGTRTEARRWKWLFVALVAAGVVECLLDLAIWPDYNRPKNLDYLIWGSSTLRWIMPVWILILSMTDLLVRQRRDWLHWLGVASYVLLAGAAAISGVRPLFL
jgi:hypothetical protein